MNWAWTGSEAMRASPSKNSTNGTLPPTTDSATSPAHCDRVRGLIDAVRPALRRRATSGPATASRRMPATAFFPVV